jgi:hypothetical protein
MEPPGRPGGSPKNKLRAGGFGPPPLLRRRQTTAAAATCGRGAMTYVLIDAIKAITFHNGLLRVDCVAAGPNNEERSAGTLLIPGNQAGAILQSLTQAMQELDKKLREQAQQATAGKAAN